MLNKLKLKLADYMRLQCLINMRTECTAQHDDQVIQHIPHGCSERHPIVSR